MGKLKLLWSFSVLIVGLLGIVKVPCSEGFTDPRDMFAINYLYENLGSPPLPGWRFGGDPCLEGWQGVECVNSNLTAIILNGANLGGQLTETLGMFTSIITIDLSNNHIGGSIPENLPPTMRRFFLSENLFTGTIPSSLSNLTLLSDMSVNNNLLEGELPDAFESLTGLINLDLSFNNLSGQLPPSMGNLSSLKTLHVGNNRLSGILDVLQDLPLIDLNIENNLFSGPIPGKLLTIPNFKKDGNPFNTTILPSPSPPAYPPSPLLEPPTHSPNAPPNHNMPTKKEQKSTTRGTLYAAVAIASFIVAVLIIIIFILKWRNRKLKNEEIPMALKVNGNKRPKGPTSNANLMLPKTDTKKEVLKDTSQKKVEHAIDMTRAGLMPPLAQKIIVEPIAPSEKARSETAQTIKLQTSVPSFPVAYLQQYTNNFTEENLIIKDKLGKVYVAALPDGKLLTVTKLDYEIAKVPEDKFFELVLRLSELKHPNVLELVGHCSEFEQRLLVYNYFSKVSLHDILHGQDDFKRELLWNARVQVALGAARALEYLHEGCQPPVIHQNFDSSKILLDDGLALRVSECGLASLMLSNPAVQICALTNYEAPEISDLGSCTDKSDVYSFGVVMLELLTGRKPYDSSRPREERYLVGWASSQLYDINALSRMVDPSIDGKLPMKSLSSFADIINRCIQHQPEFRPLMSEVVQDLTRMIEDSRRGPSNYL